MVKLLDNSKISFFEYLYLFCIIIYAGMASAFVRDFGDIRTVGNAIPLGLTVLFMIYKKVFIQSEFIEMLSILLFYSVLTIITTGSSNTFLWKFSQWSIYILVAYAICKGYKYRFFVIAETILFHLAIIGIICWVILLIVPVEFTHFISLFSFTPFNDDINYKSANVFFYTIILSHAYGGVDSDGFYLIMRNCGFAWEPGAFACFMCMAICFNVLRTKMRFKKNIPFIIFLLALASTQSTTGYSTFGIMLIVWLIYNKKIGWFVLLIPLFLFVIGLPFMSEKLEIRAEGFSDATLDNVQGNMGYDRLLSFRILLDEFLEHPLFGYGYSEPSFAKYGITTFSGIGIILSQFGIFMSTLFLLSLISSAKKLSNHFDGGASIMIIFAILGMMVSYQLWIQPFFISIWLFGFFNRKNSVSYNYQHQYS